MSKTAFYRGIVVVLALTLFAAPVAWSAPARDPSAATFALGWLEEFGEWISSVTSASETSQDRGAGIDPDGAVASSPSAGPDESSEGDRGAGIDPNG